MRYFKLSVNGETIGYYAASNSQAIAELLREKGIKVDDVAISSAEDYANLRLYCAYTDESSAKRLIENGGTFINLDETSWEEMLAEYSELDMPTLDEIKSHGGDGFKFIEPWRVDEWLRNKTGYVLWFSL